MIALASALAACGGGGSSPLGPQQQFLAPPPPPPVTTASADDFRTVEYENLWGLEAIGAAEAYAAGFDGSGVVIGVVDTNFDFDNDDVNYDPRSLGRSQVILDAFNAQFDEQPDNSVSAPFPHGPAVATTAAGVKNDTDVHGVAFGATVLAVDTLSDANLQVSTTNGKTTYTTNTWQYLLDRGVRLVNKSLGSDGESTGFVEASDPPVLLRSFSDAVFVDGGGLLVVSAGNNSDPEPSQSVLSTVDLLDNAGLLDAGPGALLIVGAVDQNLQISGFSDRAGTGPEREYFLVAPGQDLVLPWDTEADGPGLYFLQGTSFSAPHVTGAAAVLMQRWPNLTAREIANILLDTATDLGAPGTDDIYGRGLLNLAEAVRPQGTMTVAVANQVQPLAPELTGSGLVLGAAFGDGQALRSALSDVAVLDRYNRNFQTDLSGQVLSLSDSGGRLDQQMAQRRAWRSAGQYIGNALVSFAYAEDPSIVALRDVLGPAAGGDALWDQQVAFSLRGEVEGFDLVGGFGHGLMASLDQPDGPLPGTRFSVTGGAMMTPLGQGLFGFARRGLGDGFDLAFGASHASTGGLESHPIAALNERAQVQAVATSLGKSWADTRIQVTFAGSFEDGSILGSRSAGGLALTDRSSSGWLSVGASHWLGERTRLIVNATAGFTDPGRITDSLITDMGQLTTTAFMVRFDTDGLIDDRDGFSLSISQPLRVERGSAQLAAGVGFTGMGAARSVMFDTRQASLAPTGREIAMEIGYRFGWRGWQLEANTAFRKDAGHIAGRDEALVVLGLAKTF